MKQRAGMLEDILIRVTIVMLFGFGVGMISIQEDWRKAIEAIGIVSLATLIDGEFGTANDGGFLFSPPTLVWRSGFAYCMVA